MESSDPFAPIDSVDPFREAFEERAQVPSVGSLVRGSRADRFVSATKNSLSYQDASVSATNSAETVDQHHEEGLEALRRAADRHKNKVLMRQHGYHPPPTSLHRSLVHSYATETPKTASDMRLEGLETSTTHVVRHGKVRCIPAAHTGNRDETDDDVRRFMGRSGGKLRIGDRRRPASRRSVRGGHVAVRALEENAEEVFLAERREALRLQELTRRVR